MDLEKYKLKDSLEKYKQPQQKEKGIVEKFGEKSGKVLGGISETFVNPLLRAAERPFVSAARGIQGLLPGDKTGTEPMQTPFGEVKPYSEMTTGQTISEGIEVGLAGLPAEKLLKKPLTMAAEKLYQSAGKFKDVKKARKTILPAKDVSKIGLKERVWLTRGGVEKLENKIADFEGMIDEAIQAGKLKGRVNVNKIVGYVDEAKNFFKNQANRIEAKQAINYLDNLKKQFRKDFGAYMPLDKAQEIKVATGQALSRYYNKMSSYAIEGEKQLVRGLKEQILEKAPKMGTINQKLKDLYIFERQLESTMSRGRNRNLFGLGSKTGAVISGASGNIKSAVVGTLLDLADNKAIKSGLAINLDRLAGATEKGLKATKIPLINLIHNIIDQIDEE